MSNQSIVVRILVMAFTTAVGTSCIGSPDGGLAHRLDGRWQSQEVRLVRADLEEIYIFNMVLHTGDSTGVSGVMNIKYSLSTAPNAYRTIRQDLQVTLDSVAGQVVLSGGDPRVVEGPEVVGVYEADVLSCTSPREEHPEQLECRWGSDAQGTTPAVTLIRLPD